MQRETGEVCAVMHGPLPRQVFIKQPLLASTYLYKYLSEALRSYYEDPEDNTLRRSSDM